jgi:hypothetical protein
MSECQHPVTHINPDGSVVCLVCDESWLVVGNVVWLNPGHVHKGPGGRLDAYGHWVVDNAELPNG